MLAGIRSRFRNDPLVGNVIALIALGVAVGLGTAYAAGLAPDSVKSKHIAPDAAKGVDVAEGTLEQVPDAAHADDADTVGGQGPNALSRGGVVARARGDSSVAGGNPPNPPAYPLTGNTWTQEADEVDTQLAIRAQADVPSIADCNPDTNIAYVNLSVGGQEMQGASFFFTGTAQNDFVRTTVQPVPHLFEPGSPTQRTLTASISDYCQGQHIVLESLKVDVIGFR